MFDDPLGPLPLPPEMLPNPGPVLSNVPMSQPSQGVDWSRLIGPLATIALAATGHPNAAIGAGRGSMLAEESRRRQEAIDIEAAQQNERMRIQQEQYRAQEEAKRAAGVQKLIMDAATQARAAKSKTDYDNIINAAETLGAQFYGMRPNSIRGLVRYQAPNANEIMAEAGQAFLKNPANKAAIEQGNFNGSIMVDVQGDGKPIAVPVMDVLKAAGTQFDPQTGQILSVPTKKDAGSNVQLDDEAFLGAVAQFEADKGRQATQAERGQIAQQVKQRMAAAGRAPAGSDDSPLKAYQQFTAGEKLADKWKAANVATREMTRQFQLMQTGLKRAKEGDMLGGSQAVLVTFQKILDPSSVVRESEYARSAAGLSLINRIEGYAERLQKGGAGVPLPELAAMVETAKQFVADMQGYTNGQRKRIGAVAKQYGLDPALIFDDAPPENTGQPITVRAPDGKVYRFATQEQADAFKRAAGIK